MLIEYNMKIKGMGDLKDNSKKYAEFCIAPHLQGSNSRGQNSPNNDTVTSLQLFILPK